MSLMRFAMLAAVLCVLAPRVARAEYFVITATEKTQEPAQRKAVETGGWVLNTDLYSGLTPHLFAVVRGPFAKVGDAKAELASLQSSTSHRGAFVKDAGKLNLAGLTPSGPLTAVVQALIGEIQVRLVEQPGGSNPCEPQEPYLDVELTIMTAEGRPTSHGVDAAPKPRTLDLDGFWIIKRTGEIDRMRICLE